MLQSLARLSAFKNIAYFTFNRRMATLEESIDFETRSQYVTYHVLSNAMQVVPEVLFSLVARKELSLYFDLILF